MIHQLRSVWTGFVLPMIQRPDRLQVAALCYKGTGADRRVLLVTSRGTGRWVLPKGWPIRGTDASRSAMQEAWEEGGVRQGETTNDPIGSYYYRKGLNGGFSVAVTTLVYAVKVTEERDDYPEATQRTRVWVTAQEAAEMVDEPELKELLRAF